MIYPPDWLVVSLSLMSRSFSSLFSSTLSQESPHFRPCSSGYTIVSSISRCLLNYLLLFRQPERRVAVVRLQVVISAHIG
jgi:hypothetical protein